MRTMCAIMVALALLTFGGIAGSGLHAGHSQVHVLASDGGSGAGG